MNDWKMDWFDGIFISKPIGDIDTDEYPTTAGVTSST